MSKLKAEARPLREPLARGAKTGATVVVEPLLGGEMRCPPGGLENPGGRLKVARELGIGTPRSKWPWIPAPAFLITHPTAGPVLVDTAFHGSVATKPAANLGRVMARLSHARIETGRDLPSQLRERGIDARELETVVMTHLHFDHSSGISEYPHATFVLAQREWDAAANDDRPLLRGYNHAHFDYLFDYRTIDFDRPGISSYASFGRTFDLFGDGSIRIAFTPGHTPGHCSVIARLRDRDFVIAGDAIYTYAQLEGGDPPPRPVDVHNWQRSLRELQQFARTYPQAEIVAGHDRAQWSALEKRYE